MFNPLETRKYCDIFSLNSLTTISNEELFLFSIYSSNSELLEYIEEMFPLYYMHSAVGSSFFNHSIYI